MARIDTASLKEVLAKGGCEEDFRISRVKE
jgi:hypothetical protein